MDQLIKKIKSQIKGEQLLFDGVKVSEYTEEEKFLVIKAVSNRMAREKNYTSLIYAYLPHLVDIIVSLKYSDEIEEELFSLGTEVGSHLKKSKEQLFEEVEQAKFLQNFVLGYSWEETYQNVILHRLVDIDAIRTSYDNGTASDTFADNTDFLITNNLLLSRYPEFFKADDFSQLETIVSRSTKKDFDNILEFNEYRKAAKAVMLNLSKAKDKGKIKVKE